MKLTTQLFLLIVCVCALTNIPLALTILKYIAGFVLAAVVLITLLVIFLFKKLKRSIQFKQYKRKSYTVYEDDNLLS